MNDALQCPKCTRNMLWNSGIHRWTCSCENKKWFMSYVMNSDFFQSKVSEIHPFKEIEEMNQKSNNRYVLLFFTEIKE